MWITVKEYSTTQLTNLTKNWLKAQEKLIIRWMIPKTTPKETEKLPVKLKDYVVEQSTSE